MMDLRVVCEADLELVLDWENNPEFWPYSENNGPFTPLEVAQFIQECQDLEKHKQCRFLVLHDSSEEPVGALDIFEFDPIQKTAGIGILIAEEQNRRKGFAKNAIFNLIAREDIKRKIRMLWCIIHTDNLRSLHLFNACGFTVQGEILYKGKKAVKLTRYL